MGKLITVFWRDIPSHIIFKTKSGKFKKQMSPRFAEAIDRAAMRAGKGSSDAYMADWRRDIKSIEEIIHNPLLMTKSNYLRECFQMIY